MTADVDFDGKVSVEEFDGMIEAAAALPRLIFKNLFFGGGGEGFHLIIFK